MAKISVRHGVAAAYGLLFGRPLTVIGLTWLPAVCYAVGADFLVRRMDAAMSKAVPVASGVFGEYAFFYFAALLVATAFFGALIAVPLTRQAFGLREERVAAHLVVGIREIRLFFALLRYYGLVAGALVLFAIGAGVAITQGVYYAATHHMPAVWHGLPLETWLNSVAATLAVLILTVSAVRYGFFLDAIASAEDHARLSRSAALSRGNFWSIAATLFVVAVPASLVLVAFEMTFGGLNLAGFGLSATAVTPFAGILATGLVVLHALSAGASAGAYAELAEQVVHEREPAEIQHAPQELAPFVAPAEVFASAHRDVSATVVASEPPLEPEPLVEPVAVVPVPEAAVANSEEAAFQAEMTEAAEMSEPMEIATPEAASATPLPAPPPGEWVAPPPEAHFGSDPHDAQSRDAQSHEPHDGQPRPAVETALEGSPIETEYRVAPDAPTPEPLAAAVAATETHPVEAQNASADGPLPEFELPPDVGAPRPAFHPDIEDAAHNDAAHNGASKLESFDGQPEEVPDHAHDSELPPPPIDPAGVLAAQQQGFHTAPPG